MDRGLRFPATHCAPENFDPAKAGKKRAPAKPKKAHHQVRPGPSSPELPPPTHPRREPTAQRNNSIIAESIFGVNVTVTEIAPRQEFDAAYNRVLDVTLDTHSNVQADERQIDRIMVKKELAYYATALLWMKLLDVKAKEGAVTLSTEEKAIRKAVAEEHFNVPQPIFAMLSEIGNYTDRLGKETRHHVPNLPTTVVQGFGGYHAAAINVDNHNLFEEVPSLGIAGDMVMALAMPEAEPQPNFRIGLPVGARLTRNLVGNIAPIGPRRPEIQQRLAGFGITANTFQEYVQS